MPTSRTPRQRRLALAPETFRPSRVPAKDPHAAANALSAAIILRDPERYGGESALMVRWARAWQEAQA